MLLVDGANVVGARPDGWWRDRAGAARRLHDQLRRLGVPTVLVLEGAARAGVPEAVDVVHAPGEGDDTLVALAGPGDTVVTSDRGLAARVTAAGVQVRGARWLLDQLSDRLSHRPLDEGQCGTGNQPTCPTSST